MNYRKAFFMQSILNYIPEASHTYISELIARYKFKFILKKERSTKLGDFRRDRNNSFTITVNRDLSPFQFLLTFVHELAHLKTAIDYPRGTLAHGKEWKKEFRNLMLPLLNPAIFPDPLLRGLAKHMRNPKAAASSDPALWNLLRAYDENASEITLNELNNGSEFIFKKKTFIKVEKRRTRILCKEKRTGRMYLIPGIAAVAAS